MKKILLNNKKIIFFHILLLICFSAYLLSADFLFDRVFVVNGESNILDITLPNETQNIQGRVEFFQKNRLEWKEVILLSGWAFVNRQSMNGMKTYVVLKSNSSEYIFDTMPFSRWDVTQNFYNGTIDLSHSGWRANIPENVLNEDDFRIGYIIRNNTTQSFQMSRNYINKNGLFWK